jgi:hypothetical protein
MSRTAARLGVYGGILAVTFAASYGIGHATETSPAPDRAAHPTSSAAPGAAPAPVAGPSYHLEFDPWSRTADGQVGVPFKILAADGTTVTSLATANGRQVEVLLLAADRTDFASLYPDGDGNGNWTLRLPTPRPEPYQLLVRFTPAGTAHPLVLGTALVVADPSTS